MADSGLDYGAPDGGQARERDEVLRSADEGVDAEMQEWEQEYTGDAANFTSEREQKMKEIIEGRRTKFYALPKDEGIEAGAHRGVQPEPAMDENGLMGKAEDDAIGNVPEVPGTIGKGLDIRYAVLHLTGLPVSQCSTSRLFAYVTHYGAQPLGLEWINDRSCNIVFSDVKAARLALEYLCPANAAGSPIGFPSEEELEQAVEVKRSHDKGEDLDRTQAFEWTDGFMQTLLQPRMAHRIPGHLYTAPERDAAAELQTFDAQRKYADDDQEMASAATAEAPAIYRELEEEDRQRFLKGPAQEALRRIRSCLYVRWTVESLDVKGSKAAAQSQWYREHGRDAGKEVVSKVLQVGGTKDRRELLPSSRNGRGGDRATARNGHSAMDQLDREMDAWRDRADDDAVGRGSSARRRRRNGSRSATTMDALDEEMEQIRDRGGRDRSASPDRRGGASMNVDTTSIRVRGRGKMRAPSAWDTDGGSGGRDPYASLQSRMAVDPRRTDRWGNHGQDGGSLAERLRAPTGSDNGLAQRLSPSSGASGKQGGGGGGDLFGRIR